VIYELRIYRCLPNRLSALLKRFETNTLRIWEKHGIRQAGFWTTVIGESNLDLTYLLAWESLAEREKKWAAFQSDPEWIAARDASEKDGPIVATLEFDLAADVVLEREVACLPLWGWAAQAFRLCGLEPCERSRSTSRRR
jgi:NIPSNAP